MNEKIINWGIIGLGNIANKFAKDLITVRGAQLYAVASRTQEKADDFASKYGAIKAYNTYEALVKDTNIDAVYIATPHSMHKDNTLLCLNHGIAVLCEKPFAMNTDEVSTMISKAKESNVLLMEALWTYFLPHYEYVLQELKNKTFGKLLKVEADFGFYKKFDDSSRLFKKSLGGGSLLDIGIYPIFVALSTLGVPKNIKADATFFENGADSSCRMVFEYNDGVTAHLRSTLLEKTPTEAVFYCEKGTIKMNSGFFMPTTVTIHSGNKEKTIDFNYKTVGYNYEVLHFNALLREGKLESDIMTFDFSKQLIALLDQVRSQIKLEYS